MQLMYDCLSGTKSIDFAPHYESDQKNGKKTTNIFRRFCCCLLMSKCLGTHNNVLNIFAFVNANDSWVELFMAVAALTRPIQLIFTHPNTYLMRRFAKFIQQQLNSIQSNRIRNKSIREANQRQ